MAWYATRLIRRARRTGTPGHAVYGLGRAFGLVAGLVAGLSATVFATEVRFAASVAGAAACLGVLLAVWWIYRVYSRQARRILGEVRGAEWDNPFNVQMAALVQGPLLGVPIAGSALALILHLLADPAGLRITPLAASLCIYPGILLYGLHARWVARRMLRDPEALPDQLSRRVESALGPGSTLHMAVLPTGGAAFYNALAVRGVTPHSIWISGPLVEALSPDEAAAVLVHEASHIDRRDDLRLLATAIAIHALMLGAMSFWREVTLPVACGLFVVAYLFALALLGQRNELIADAKAAEAGLADAMGRALIALHRLNAVPRRTGSETFATHPLLEKRLRALGTAAPEPTAEEAPLPRGESHRLLGWLAVVCLAALVLALLWRVAREDAKPWSDPESYREGAAPTELDSIRRADTG